MQTVIVQLSGPYVTVNQTLKSYRIERRQDKERANDKGGEQKDD